MKNQDNSKYDIGIENLPKIDKFIVILISSLALLVLGIMLILFYWSSVGFTSEETKDYYDFGDHSSDDPGLTYTVYGRVAYVKYVGYRFQQAGGVNPGLPVYEGDNATYISLDGGIAFFIQGDYEDRISVGQTIYASGHFRYMGARSPYLGRSMIESKIEDVHDATFINFLFYMITIVGAELSIVSIVIFIKVYNERERKLQKLVKLIDGIRTELDLIFIKYQMGKISTDDISNIDKIEQEAEIIQNYFENIGNVKLISKINDLLGTISQMRSQIVVSGDY